jgi:hypothetical protein
VSIASPSPKGVPGVGVCATTTQLLSMNWLRPCPVPSCEREKNTPVVWIVSCACCKFMHTTFGIRCAAAVGGGGGGGAMVVVVGGTAVVVVLVVVELDVVVVDVLVVVVARELVVVLSAASSLLPPPHAATTTTSALRISTVAPLTRVIVPASQPVAA